MHFGAVPLRVLLDSRISGLHFRALICIAGHDQLSRHREKPGPGCFASIATLTAEIGCNYTNVSTAINELVRWGYLKQKPNPDDARKSIYQVVYNDDDQKAMLHGEALPRGKQSLQKVGLQAKEWTQIVCPPESQPTDSKEELRPNIFREADIKRFGEARRHSAKRAALDESDIPAMRREVASIRARWEAGGADLEGELHFLNEAARRLGKDDPDGRDAARLRDEINAAATNRMLADVQRA